jgi:hypothetical protein
MASEEKIRDLAYSIWEQEGRPDGKDVEHYLRAKKMLEDKEALHLMELKPAATVKELAGPKPVLSLQPAHTRNSRERHMRK